MRAQAGRLSITQRTPEGDEQGFTLIELLVVIIIIGILAAIAVPVFLAQRHKSYDATAKSDLKNLANFQEIYLNDFGSYGTATQLINDEPLMVVSAHDHMTVVFKGLEAYCLTATYRGSRTWVYDSLNGGIQPQGATCPAPGGAWTDGGFLDGTG
jgi:type IV pilus assembly protein PilA